MRLFQSLLLGSVVLAVSLRCARHPCTSIRALKRFRHESHISQESAPQIC
jgi:hypothetical protein